MSTSQRERNARKNGKVPQWSVQESSRTKPVVANAANEDEKETKPPPSRPLGAAGAISSRLSTGTATCPDVRQQLAALKHDVARCMTVEEVHQTLELQDKSNGAAVTVLLIAAVAVAAFFAGQRVKAIGAMPVTDGN